MIIFNNLSKAYYGKNYVVTNLNLKINPGEIIGLIGHNGAGKTTTLNRIPISNFFKKDNFQYFFRRRL
ncbi:ATP-binding cassette domain-containing protein [Clostridium sp.]|uniref:ATP-binding cassette domain-containing protein n=1 Tax=Clostridium sp. TaxID=1506 RepID=UPI003993BCB3